MLFQGYASSIAGVLLSVTLLGACSTPGQTLKLRQTSLGIAIQHEIESTPFYPQLDYYCGPATLAAMVNFHGQPAEPEDIASQIYVPDLKGSLQEEIVAAARQFNLLPVQLDGTLASLLREIASGNPVLVLQNLSFESIPNWHYAIAMGYDLKTETIILRSGTHKRLTRPFSLLERTWQRANNWALVIVPVGVIPVTVSADSYLSSLIDFEQTSDINLAHQAYIEASKKWPSNLLAQIGIGNTAYALKDFAMSESAYHTALQLSPRLGQLWNNYAYALAQQDKKVESLVAIKRAIEISPNNKNYQHSATELAEWSAQ
ncbi:MAG: tetratricopeptide (TPR) repeat protein [Polaribacter sp.]|jgi:tetratricopeptide (TPR) repeat protein